MNRCIGFILVLAAVLGLPVWAQAPAPVARVAVSVGDAVKVGPTGQTTALQAGSSLAPGDRVRTGPDALAILVFSDQGRMSLRGDSELWIRHYEVDPSGVRTRIEIDLVRGTVRQISGNGSRAQPERYKLNTPIAVIGVRGTDFLAKATGDAVEAFVHEGHIVLLPLGDPCGQAATSACSPMATVSSASNLRYVRLSAAGQVEQRDFRPGELEKIFGVDVARAARSGPVQARLPVLPGDFQLPAGTQFITETIFAASAADRFNLPAWSPAAPSTSGSSSAPPTSSSTVSDTTVVVSGLPAGIPSATTGGTPLTSSTAPVDSNVSTSGATPSGAPVSTNTAPAPADSSAPAPGAGAASSNVVASGSAAAAGADAPAVPPVAVAVALPRQLVWGRFTNAAAVTSTLLIPYADAAQDRHVTVGELGQYALWRADPSGRLDPALKGSASFSLAAAEAWFVQPSVISAAQVRSASLSVDFDRSTFTAAVAMSHAVGGQAELAVNGLVNNEGVFVGVKGSERVAGALTRDGKEAGYLFSKDVANGTFRGITLWGRK